MELKHWNLETDSDGIAWLRIDKAESSANSRCLIRFVMAENEPYSAPISSSEGWERS